MKEFDIVFRLTDEKTAVAWLNKVGPKQIMEEAAKYIMSLRKELDNFMKEKERDA